MSKHFMSEVRRLDDHEARDRLDTVTIDVESSSPEDPETDSSLPDAGLDSDFDSPPSDSDSQSSDPQIAEETQETDELTESAIGSGSSPLDSLDAGEDSDGLDELDEESSIDADGLDESEEGIEEAIDSQAERPGSDPEVLSAAQVLGSGVEAKANPESDVDISVAEGIQAEAPAIEASAVQLDSQTDSQSDAQTDSQSDAQSDASEPPSSGDELEALKVSLRAAQQREATLENRIADLEQQLQAKNEAIAQLQVEFSQHLRSTASLSQDLAEAKQYILKLTRTVEQTVDQVVAQTAEPPSDPEAASPGSSTAPPPAQPRPASRPTAPTSASGRSPSERLDERYIRRPARRPGLTRSSSGTLPQGLPPMSTEQLTEPIASPPVRSRAPLARQPLHLPERLERSHEDAETQRQTPASQDGERSQTKFSESGKGNQPTPDLSQSPSSSKTSSQTSIQRKVIRPRKDVPSASRDTTTKVHKPKLSNSDIGWFD